MFVVDWHQDFITELQHHNQDISTKVKDIHGDIPSWQAGNFKVIVGAVFPLKRHWGEYHPEAPLNHLIRCIERTRELTDLYSENLMIIENRKDLDSCLKSSKIGILLGYEGAYGIYDRWTLKAIWKLGVRVLGLTWNYESPWASGAKDEYDTGLTSIGKKLLPLASDIGFIIDLAHSSPKTIEQVLKMDLRPPIASHTGILKNPKTKRNISLKTAEKIIEKGGIVGIALAKLFFEDESIDFSLTVESIANLLKHFEHGIVIGTDYFGFGLDQAITGLERVDKLPYLLNELKKYRLRQTRIKRFASGDSIDYLKKYLP